MNPLAGFYAAVTRKSPTGDSPHGPEGWYVTQYGECLLFLNEFQVPRTTVNTKRGSARLYLPNHTASLINFDQG